MVGYFSSVARCAAPLRAARDKKIGALILWLLSMAAAAAYGQAIPLGTSADFGVLAGAAVTNSGSTVIVGSVGVSPGTSITGFPPGSIQTGTGTLHSADAVALQAQSDLTIAYNTAAGAVCGAAIPDGVLAGLTLTPGVYCMNAANLSGTLTLNGAGSYVFKTASSLTVGSGAAVVLINGASSCNVVWQVTSSATVGTGASMAGNILALTSITLNTGAQLSGRMLASTGAVTLDSNTVSACTSEPASPPALIPTTIDVVGVPTAPIVGTSVEAQSHLNDGSSPTGTITFQLFSQNLCVGIPMFTTNVTITGNGSYTSPGYVPGSPGAYSWRASYSGDATNATSSSGCGAITVAALPPVTPPATAAAAPLGGGTSLLIAIFALVLGIRRLRRSRQQSPLS